MEDYHAQDLTQEQDLAKQNLVLLMDSGQSGLNGPLVKILVMEPQKTPLDLEHAQILHLHMEVLIALIKIMTLRIVLQKFAQVITLLLEKNKTGFLLIYLDSCNSLGENF